MDPLLPRFKEAVSLALKDDVSRRNLANVLSRRAVMRGRAWPPYPRLETLRKQARAAREQAIAQLPSLVKALEEQARINGIHVYHASTAAQATEYIVQVVESASPRTVAYAQADVLEEIGLYRALANTGFHVTDVDMAWHVLHMMDDLPAHPAVPLGHLSPRDVARVWRETTGQDVRPDALSLARAMRGHIRPVFRRMDVGIIAATFGVAKTGALVFTDDEGHTAMTAALSRVLVVVMSVDRVVAEFHDVGTLLEVRARGLVGEAAHRQVTMLRSSAKGIRADEVHLILVDNGRSHWTDMGLGETLMCVGCAMCADVCPVIRHVGGQVFNSPYMGPIGAVISPLLWPKTHADIAFAMPSCAECDEVCPLSIDINDLPVRTRQVLEDKGAGRGSPISWLRKQGRLPKALLPVELETFASQSHFTAFPNSVEDETNEQSPSGPPLHRLVQGLRQRGVEIYQTDTPVAARLHVATVLQEMGADLVVGWDEEDLGLDGLVDALAAVGIRYRGPDSAYRAGGQVSHEWAQARVGVVAARAALAGTGLLVLEGSPRKPLAAALLPQALFVLVPADQIYSSWSEWPQGESMENALLVGGPTRTLAIAGEEVAPGVGVEEVHVIVVGEESGGGRWESNPPRPSL